MDAVRMEKEAITAQVRELLARVQRRAAQGAQVVALHGELGAGKTTFTQELARALGVTETVTSPTFVIEKIYDLPDPLPEQAAPLPFKRLVHIDAYRLDAAQDVRVLGWDQLVQDAGNLVVVEWAERIADALPADTLHLRFALVDETTRELTYGNA